MKRILVPTDFSPNATKALGYAVQVARRAKAEIILLHATEFDESLNEVKEAIKKLEIRKKSIEDTEGISVTTELMSGIAAEPAIRNAITDFKIDLVIMGTLGNATLKDKIFGSITAAIIGKSSVPVLAIPLLSEWDTHPDILLAINDFSIEDKTLSPVIQLATLLGSEIQAAIFTDADDDYVEDYDVHEKEIATFRDQLKAKHPDLTIHAVHLAGRRFMENLQNWIDEHKIGMVVMLTHKRNILESFFNRSMTKKMSYHTNIPLLAIPV